MTGFMRPIFVSAINHQYGSWREVDALLGAPGVMPGAVEHLKQFGLRRYSVLDAAAGEYLAGCVRGTLDKASLLATDIDAVVSFSSTLDAYAEADDLARMAADLGLTNALPLGLTLGQCTNYSTALVVARGLIEASGLDNVLLVGSDRLDEARASRVFAERISVYSDGLVSCVVSREPRTGFQVGEIQHQFSPAISRLDARKDFLGFLQLFSAGMREASRKLCLTAGLKPSAFSRLIPANLNISVLRNFAELVGMPFERTYVDNVGRYGHTFAYDQLIALETLQAERTLESGQRLMLIGVGGNYLFSALSCSVC